MSTTKTSMPKAAQQFIDDAKTAGFTVQVTQEPGYLAIYAERPRHEGTGTVSGAVVWSDQTVYDSPLSGERLGFRTSGGRTAFRFSYGNAQDFAGTHHACKSVRQVRGHIGLAI